VGSKIATCKGVTYLTMGGTSYIVLADHDYAQSELYSWNGNNFALIQTIASTASNIYSWEFVSVGNSNFLIAASLNGTMVYNWTGISFLYSASISLSFQTQNATTYSVKCFISGSNTYCLTASNNIQLYVYNDTVQRFTYLTTFHKLANIQIYRMRISNSSLGLFLAVSDFNGNTSSVYLFDHATFNLVQTFSNVLNGWDVFLFVIDSKLYLSFQDISQTTQIQYKYNSRVQLFDQTSIIKLPNGLSWNHFLIGNMGYLFGTSTLSIGNLYQLICETYPLC